VHLVGFYYKKKYNEYLVQICFVLKFEMLFVRFSFPFSKTTILTSEFVNLWWFKFPGQHINFAEIKIMGT